MRRTAPGVMPTVSARGLPPPLSPERVRMAREVHGDAAVDRYMKHLDIGDPLADAVIAHFDDASPGRAIRVLDQVLNQGLESVGNPPPELSALMGQLSHVPDWVDWREMRHASRRVLQNGLLTALAFAAFALPHCYLATANMPLVFTGRLFRETAPPLRQNHALRHRIVHAGWPAARCGRFQDGRHGSSIPCARSPGDPQFGAVGFAPLRSSPESVAHGDQRGLLFLYVAEG